MKIDIQLDKDTFSIVIVDSNKTIATDIILYDKDLDNKLLQSLDKLIKQYKINIPLTICTFSTTLKEYSTSLKISQALIKGMGFRC